MATIDVTCRFQCQSCRKNFQIDYTYRACKPGIKEQIVDLAMNNASIRDNARALHEVDEMWSFVMGKKLQRWLWYAWKPRLKRIIAHAFGEGSTETLNILLMRMKQFNVPFCCTDKFKAYDILPKEKYIVGKLYIQRIERENLMLRNRLKRLNCKILGYSKSADMHDKVIGTFIERNYYL